MFNACASKRWLAPTQCNPMSTGERRQHLGMAEDEWTYVPVDREYVRDESAASQCSLYLTSPQVIMPSCYRPSQMCSQHPVVNKPSTLSSMCEIWITDLPEPSVKVSPEEHSMPKMATMSPASASWMSSSSFALMRTKRGTCGTCQNYFVLLDLL